MTAPGQKRRAADLADHHGERARVVDEHMFTVPTPGGATITFRLQLFTGPGLRPVAIATQSAGDAGSLSNLAEYVAELVRAEFVPHDAEPPLWIQRLVGYDGSEPTTLFVSLTEPAEHRNGLRLLTPQWLGMLPGTLEQLVGEEPDLSRGEGYVPQPEVEPAPVRFEMIALAQLPVAAPFREKACMGPGSRWTRAVPGSCSAGSCGDGAAGTTKATGRPSTGSPRDTSRRRRPARRPT